MKAFDPNYKLLDEMYQDDYYPAFLVNKVKDELQKVIDLLESGETDTDAVQETLDEAVCGINDLQEEFDENDSEIETVARECIAAAVAYILEWFNIPIDTEEAIRNVPHPHIFRAVNCCWDLSRPPKKEKRKLSAKLVTTMAWGECPRFDHMAVTVPSRPEKRRHG